MSAFGQTNQSNREAHLKFMQTFAGNYFIQQNYAVICLVIKIYLNIYIP
jgi:hypothetical protein